MKQKPSHLRRNPKASILQKRIPGKQLEVKNKTALLQKKQWIALGEMILHFLG
jgi:hypothetical protein